MVRRLKRHGRTVKVVEFRCARCKLGLLATEREAVPPKQGLVPYCQDCLRQGVASVMTRRVFTSGPPDLLV